MSERDPRNAPKPGDEIYIRRVLRVIRYENGARILELRRMGYRISTSARDHETGLVVYQMDPEATA